MIEQLQGSGGNTLGFRVSGAVSKADYDILRPATEAALESNDEIHLLLDLTDFGHEKVSAWKADLQFGRDFHKRIARLAVVGDGLTERLIADVAHPFYAQESKHFSDVDAAWAWLEESG